MRRFAWLFDCVPIAGWKSACRHRLEHPGAMGLALAVVLLFGPAPVRASVITTGDVVPGGADNYWGSWLVDKVTVGATGFGSLNIESGGWVNNMWSSIGRDPGSTGIATVTGADSLWFNESTRCVGEAGSGSLNIESAGVVTNTFGYIGRDPGSTGVATVTGVDSQWTNSSSLSVGREGSGTLNIESAGVVTNTDGYIGIESGSTGVATVTGADSQWTNSSTLYVGRYGSGTLNIESGGVVTNTYGNIGSGSVSTGIAATDLPQEIGEFQLSATPTLPGGTSIGFVFPTGMDLAALTAFVTGGSAAPSYGGGSFSWELFVEGDTEVPEPATISLIAMGLIGLALIGVRRRRAA